MAQSKEQTFTFFTPEQAAQYAKDRGSSYSTLLYQQIIDFHGSRPRDTFLDVGTGPGKVVFDLLPNFSRGLGCDSSEQMIEQAKKDAARLGVSERTAWAVASGEDCGDVCVDEKETLVLIDGLRTVAMAAHWFDMTSFYRSAARALKPGGTLALWTLSSYYAHPSMKNWKQVDEILHDLEDGMLGPYAMPGNMISRNAYDDLPLPWHTQETQKIFDKASFERVDWDRHGVPSAPALPDGTPAPFLNMEKQTVSSFIDGFGSASMIIRWRQANPEKANTEDDPVHITAKRLKAVMDDDEELVAGSSTSLLLFRRL